ncbi:hypothetical protein C2845_PM10G16170 [Panicum miliaceum]|uniref:Uncharacterized protein n=1 Tax=Panicum miliaceum TaxID=4540 RepID=A0A3L6PHX7_PANMI|nr:hypothetical protein C2845_PM10G16170 [Panicum miliaceum]
MGFSRRFLNLIVEKRISAAKSLRCIDLTRQHFFNTTTPQQTSGNGSESEKGPEDATSWAPAADAGNQKNTQVAAGAGGVKMERICLPSPSFSFITSPNRYWWTLNCFPLAGRKMLFTDQSGRTLLFDADTRDVATMPDLHRSKLRPLSLFVPSADLEGCDCDDGGGSVFVMERIPGPEVRCSRQQMSHQFEAFVYRKPTLTSFSKSWQCQLLPPPPFICDPGKYYRDNNRPRITSYAVIGGGSHICISAEGADTYCLDTDGHLAAADLSSMDSQQPQIVGVWKELNLPKEWNVTQVPQLVNLGSGRFVIVRFLQTQDQTDDLGAEIEEHYFVVLTGVEVVSRAHDHVIGNGNDNGSDADATVGALGEFALALRYIPFHVLL